MSTGRGAWLLPRHIAGRPWDHHLTRASDALPRRVRLLAFEALVRAEYARRGLDPRARGLALPPFEPLVSRVTPGVSLLDSRLPVAFRPAIADADRNEVIFSDGTTTKADAIVWCTGYTTRLPALPLGSVGPDLGLVDRVFSPSLAALAFVGMVVVGGRVWPVMDLQASWVARVFAGDAAPQLAGHRGPRAPGADLLRVEYVPFMRALAKAARRADRPPRGPFGLFAPVKAADFAQMPPSS